MKYFEAHSVYEFKDIDGNTPEILMVDGNRTGGKTTAFSRLCVDDFLKDNSEKFFLLYRYKNEMDNVATAFFKDIKGLFFEGHEMTSKSHAHGTYHELFLDGKSCGYCSALTMASKIKRYSHIFSDVKKIFFDEYQDENNLYLPNEVKMFESVHTTIARGQGNAVRFVPVYMCSNSISIFNPYYTALRITGKINSKTKVYKGEGFVLLRLVIKDVAEAQKKSAFNRAFSGSSYSDSAIDNTFLNDDSFNVEKMQTSGTAAFNFIFNAVLYSVYRSGDIWYVKKGGDKTINPTFGVLQSDRGNGVKAFKNSSYYTFMRLYYEDACIYFETTETKHAFMNLLFN